MSRYLLLLILTIFSADVLAVSVFSNEQLLSRQKELYKTEAWDSFFGGALFLRAQNPKTDILDQALALELMALARHCQWKLIDDLKENQKLSLKGPMCQEALTMINLKKEYKVFAKDTKEKSESLHQRLQNSKSEWPIDITQLANITTPEKLKMSIRSLCPL